MAILSFEGIPGQQIAWNNSPGSAPTFPGGCPLPCPPFPGSLQPRQVPLAWRTVPHWRNSITSPSFLGAVQQPFPVAMIHSSDSATKQGPVHPSIKMPKANTLYRLSRRYALYSVYRHHLHRLQVSPLCPSRIPGQFRRHLPDLKTP